MSSRAVKIGLAAAAAGGGYYLYRSKFDVKRAEVLAKQDFDRVSRATSEVANGQASKDRSAENYGKKLDDAVRQAKTDFDDRFQAANDKARKLYGDVETKYGNLQTDARKKYDDLLAEAHKNYDSLDSETRKRLDELRKSVESGADEASKQIDQTAADVSKRISEAADQSKGYVDNVKGWLGGGKK